MQNVNFQVSAKDGAVIKRVVDRAMRIARDNGWDDVDRLHMHMDLCACHANGCPLQLQRLLEADTFNFNHDVFGIRRHLDRATGHLMRHFSPRFAEKQARAAA